MRQYYNPDLQEFDYKESEHERVRELERLRAERLEELRKLEKEGEEE